MDKQQILEIAKSDPRFSQAILTLENEIGEMPITTEGLDEIVQMLEFALNNPDKYAEVLKAAIEDDLVDPGDLPEQFDPVAIISLLVMMYGMQERTKQKGFARGGLAKVAAQGRHGDTMLAHINPREAAMLKRMGGSGTTNPKTGLPEYFSFKDFVKIALPIALNFIAPGIGTAIGSTLGASAAWAPIVGGAILGGGTSALTGGNILQGALMGGLGGGLGNMAGTAADKAFGFGLGDVGKNILGGALVGGAAGVATGQGFGKGALQGALGSGIGELAGSASGPTALQQGISAAGKTFGQGLTAGYDPKTAALMGATSGLTTGFTYKPSDAVVEGLKTDDAPKTVKLPDGTEVSAPGTTATNAQGQTGTYKLDPATGTVKFVPNAGSYVLNPQTNAIEWKATEPSFFDKALKGGPFESTPSTTTGAKPSGGISTGQVLGGLGLLSALQSPPPPAAQEAIKKMSPEQQEYFNRPSVFWDWNKMQNDANAANMSLDQFMNSNWPRITGYAQSGPGDVSSMKGAYNLTGTEDTTNMAKGGALSAVARYAQGSGSGRADTIDAKLSDGEYVIDAETVAMLGDGSNKEGAKRLDAMRQNIRSHKGKALSKGKFSPNAKSPLTYLKEFA
jgi:hypothetical protein